MANARRHMANAVNKFHNQSATTEHPRSHYARTPEGSSEGGNECKSSEALERQSLVPQLSPQWEKSKGRSGDSSSGENSSQRGQGRNNMRDHAKSGDGSGSAALKHHALPHWQACASSAEEEPVNLVRPDTRKVESKIALSRCHQTSRATVQPPWTLRLVLLNHLRWRRATRILQLGNRQTNASPTALRKQRPASRNKKTFRSFLDRLVDFREITIFTSQNVTTTVKVNFRKYSYNRKTVCNEKRFVLRAGVLPTCIQAPIQFDNLQAL